ncbi:peptide ABC transporter substrate-binding protein [Eubacteriales bacterium OttesenSCG-928-M02]|nr:peptide ABC transporter substrate-binding protein [Eubacteriales bacterium OttesenSCG-928-M02]
MKRLVCFICAILLLFSLWGCSKIAELDPTPTPIETQVIPPENTPQEGGSISIAMPQTPGSWNPLLATSREMVDLWSLVYDGLVRFDEHQKPIPGLAMNWEVGEDEKTWTFTLRSDVAFHDGKKLTSQDVIKTLDMIKRHQGDSKITSRYTWIFDVIESYSAQGEDKVIVVAKKKGHQLVHAMAFPVLPQGYGGGSEPPSGTGVYRIDSLSKGETMTLSANGDGWRKKPYITNITVKAIQDTGTALSSLEVGTVDLVHTNSLLAGSYKKEGITNLASVTTQNFECIVPNMNRGNLQDKRMRQALMYALDRGSIINEGYLGNAILADGPVAPNNYMSDVSQVTYEYNPGKARNILAELGYTDTNGDGYVDKGGTNLTFTMIVNENPGQNVRAGAALLIQRQLQSVGIRINLETMAGEAYRTALKNGNFDLALCGFGLTSDYDVDSILRTGGSQNYGRYSSQTLNGLLTAYQNAIEERDIVSTRRALNNAIVEELPIISLYFQANSLVYASAIKGIGTIWDSNIYRTVEEWYLYESSDDFKVGAGGD